MEQDVGIAGGRDFNESPADPLQEQVVQAAQIGLRDARGRFPAG
jgi:hypothetical protein